MMYKYIIFICIASYIPVHADLIVSSGETQRGTDYPYEVSLNIGPGWYRSQSGVIAHENNDSTLILFQTKFDPFCALIAEFTVKPHANAFLNINIGGGLLPKGHSTFIYKNCFSHIVEKEYRCYKARFFNANMTTGINHAITKNFDIETGIGYSYDYGQLKIAHDIEINYYTVGPILNFGFNANLKPYAFNITYSFLPNFYKEREYTKSTNTMVTLSFPLSFTNHIDLTGQYSLNKHISCGITCSFDFFKGYKHGYGTQTCPQNSNPWYTYLYDKLDTLILIGFISAAF